MHGNLTLTHMRNDGFSMLTLGGILESLSQAQCISRAQTLAKREAQSEMRQSYMRVDPKKIYVRKWDLGYLRLSEITSDDKHSCDLSYLG